MDSRTQSAAQLALYFAKIIVGHPDKVTAVERPGPRGKIVTLGGASSDMGMLMGKNGRHCNALNHLVKLAHPGVVVCVDTRPHCEACRPDIGTRTDWSLEEEDALRARVMETVAMVSDKATAKRQQVVGMSTYSIRGLQPDDISAIHALFRAYGKLRGRNVEICPHESSESQAN